MRAITAAPPANLDRTSLARLLAGSSWTRVGSREQIRFVDRPDGRPNGFARPPGSRDRAIRAVEIDLIRDRRAWLVEIDHQLYTVGACALPAMPREMRPRLTTCLEHRDAGGGFGGQGYGGVTYGGR
jgi:hypothetical protein